MVIRLKFKLLFLDTGVDGLIQHKKTRRKKFEAFLGTLEKQDELITEFDERLWYDLADHIKVCSNSVDVEFKGGMTIKICEL